MSDHGTKDYENVFGNGFPSSLSGMEEFAELSVRAMNAHDALVEALSAYVDESLDLTDLPCHQGLFRADQCRRCSRELNARAALALARGEV